jgi:pimeloyl-ACP methyl ester carboxylesterase
VLFVHGGAYPGEIFDVIFDGVSCPGQHHQWPQHHCWGQDQFIDEDDYRSWLDYLARRNFDVYFVDVRGYGRSTRPPEMGQPADENPPLVSTEIALRDVETAVDFILQWREIPRLQLIGWSWGTVLAEAMPRSIPSVSNGLYSMRPIGRDGAHLSFKKADLFWALIGPSLASRPFKIGSAASPTLLSGPARDGSFFGRTRPAPRKPSSRRI